MPLLYNNILKTLENVPDDNYTDFVASGQYSPRRNAKVQVVAPDGAIGTIPSDNAQMAFNQGFRYQTRDEAAAKMQADIQQIKEEAYTPEAAFAVGAARGATFGLSDVATRMIGGKNAAESLRQLEETRPTASLIGELTGAVGSAFIPGSAVAQVGKVGTAVASKTAVPLVELAAKGTTGQIVSEILAKGAGSAVEGAFYATGQLVSDLALGDPNVTAANTMLNYGVNILGGGVLGGLVPGGATLAKKSINKLGTILKEDLNAPSKAMQAYNKLISFFKISSPEQKKSLKEFTASVPTARANRELTFDLVENPQKATEFITNAAREIKELGKQEAQTLGNLRELARENLANIKYSKKSDKLSEISSITESLNKSIKEIERKPNRYVGGALTDLEDVLETVISKAKSADNLADMHKAVHDSRMLLDDLFEGVRKSNTPEAINTRKIIKNSRNYMTNMLHDEKTFPNLGEAFSEADAAFNQYLTAAKQFQNTFEGNVVLPSGIIGKEVKGTKTGSLVKNPLSAIANEKQEVFDQLSTAVNKLTEASEKIGELDPKRTQQLLAGVNDNLNKIKVARNAAIMLDRLEAKTGRSILASVTGYGVGTLAQESGVADIPGLGVAGLLGGALLANPKTVMMYLMRMERSNIAAANAVDEASRRLLNMQVPASVANSVKGLNALRGQGVSSHIDTIEKESHEEEMDDIDLFKSKINKQEDIPYLDDMIKVELPVLDEAAPNVYTSMVNIHARAATYLRSKLPPDRDALFAGKTILSTYQKLSLDRTVAAIQNPGELLHQMVEKNIRPETVDAVRTVYPEIFQAIQKQISEQLAEPWVQKNLDRKTRIELGKILGIPTTEATQNTDILQSVWTKYNESLQSSSSSNRKMKLPSTASPMRNIETRMMEG